MQLDLSHIFLTLKSAFKHYSNNYLIVNSDTPERFELVGQKVYNVVSLKAGQITRHKNTYFAGIVIRKDFVAFYFKPVIGEDNYFQSKYPELMRLKKGKYTFHIRQLSPELLQEIQGALKDGYKLYKEKQLIN